jgi:hypothetical protein
MIASGFRWSTAALPIVGQGKEAPNCLVGMATPPRCTLHHGRVLLAPPIVEIGQIIRPLTPPVHGARRVSVIDEAAGGRLYLRQASIENGDAMLLWLADQSGECCSHLWWRIRETSLNKGEQILPPRAWSMTWSPDRVT